MKKVMLSMLAIALAATTVMADGNKPAKKETVKQATCSSCHKDKCTKKCDKAMTKAECKKAGC